MPCDGLKDQVIYFSELAEAWRAPAAWGCMRDKGGIGSPFSWTLRLRLGGVVGPCTAALCEHLPLMMC